MFLIKLYVKVKYCILSLEIGLYFKLIDLLLKQLRIFKKLLLHLKNDKENLFFIETKKLLLISLKLFIYFLIMLFPLIILIIT